MKKKISIVTSAHNEEGNVEELARQLKQLFQDKVEYDFEVIFVDNGSHDGTFLRMLGVRAEDPRFRVLRLSRMFTMDEGHAAGLRYATGDACVLMTSNLQDTPSTIPLFLEKWEEGYENVYGVVKSRPGKSVARRVCSQLFYLVINRLTGDLIPRNVSDFRLVDRKVYAVINQMPERNRFMRGMMAWVGFRSIGIEFERAPRFSGTSHASFMPVFRTAIRGIFAFSYVPIRIMGWFGFFLSGVSILYLLYTVVRVLVKGVPFPGYGTITSLMLLLFGCVFLMLGMLGQYLAMIFEEVKQRPGFIVSQSIGFDEEG